MIFFIATDSSNAIKTNVHVCLPVRDENQLPLAYRNIPAATNLTLKERERDSVRSVIYIIYMSNTLHTHTSCATTTVLRQIVLGVYFLVRMGCVPN